MNRHYLCLILAWTSAIVINGFWCTNRNHKARAFSVRLGTNFENEVLHINKCRYRARVSYDGTNYRGWQSQGSKTFCIQEVMKRAFSRRFNHSISVVAASRTDAGVHAEGQCIHFDLPTHVEDTIKLQYVMNKILPSDIRLFNISCVSNLMGTGDAYESAWHACQQASQKHYVYKICTNSFTDPAKTRYYANFYRDIDISILQSALQLFVGEYDFKCFTNKLQKFKTDLLEKGVILKTRRRIHNIELVDEG